MTQYIEDVEGVRPTGRLVDARDSFYEENKHLINAGINPQYKQYKKLVKAVERASRPIGGGFFEKMLNSL